MQRCRGFSGPIVMDSMGFCRLIAASLILGNLSTPGLFLEKQIKGMCTSPHRASTLRLFPCIRGSTVTVRSFEVSPNGLWASFPHSCVFSAVPHLDTNSATDGGVQQLKTSGTR